MSQRFLIITMSLLFVLFWFDGALRVSNSGASSDTAAAPLILLLVDMDLPIKSHQLAKLLSLLWWVQKFLMAIAKNLKATLPINGACPLSCQVPTRTRTNRVKTTSNFSPYSSLFLIQSSKYLAFAKCLAPAFG